MSDEIVDVLRVAAALAGTGAAWWVVHWLTTRTEERRRELETRRQLLQVAVVLVGLVAIVLALPVSGQVEGAMLGALGVAVAAMIGLSSTTIVGNALAGLMLRSVGNFKVNDWVRVDGHFGKVTYRRLLATEIQTEDRDLTTLPNLFLATHPVRVVRQSGTIVSTTVSIGYDVHRLRLEPMFADAALDAGLTDPFTYVMELGNHAVTYRVAGFLKPVDNLLTVRSALREAIFDRLCDAEIEIVSPDFMNQRRLDPSVPVVARRPAGPAPVEAAQEPEEIMFDKAEAAAAIQELHAELEAAQTRLSELEPLRKAATEDQWVALDADIVEAQARIEALTEELEASEEADVD